MNVGINVISMEIEVCSGILTNGFVDILIGYKTPVNKITYIF